MTATSLAGPAAPAASISDHARIGKAHQHPEGMAFSRALLAGEAPPSPATGRPAACRCRRLCPA